MSLPQSSSPRIRYGCSICGNETDAFEGTARYSARVCRDCFGKRKDLRTNSLNDLTGKEWASFSKSVESYPDVRSAKQKKHGAAFPETMAARFIEMYSQRGQTVLDPFAGVGTTLDAATKLGRRAVGVELSAEFADLAEADLAASSDAYLLRGDSRVVLAELEAESVDLIVTSPPYGALLRDVKGGFAYKWKEHSKLSTVRNPRPYSDDARDLGNMSYEDYLDAIEQVMGETHRVASAGAYAVWVVKDFRALKQGRAFVPFHMDVTAVAARAGWQLWDIQIMDQTKFRPLVVLGYPSRNYYLNIGHSYNLVFRKSLE